MVQTTVKPPGFSRPTSSFPKALHASFLRKWFISKIEKKNPKNQESFSTCSKT